MGKIISILSMKKYFILLILLLSKGFSAQYQPKNISKKEITDAENYAQKTYATLSTDDKIGQLFIVALYTNKGTEYIKNIVKKEHIGGIILMQDNIEKSIDLINLFQKESKIGLFVGIDAEWGLYQRFPNGYKFPWAMTLGAIQDNNLLYEMSTQIAKDCKKIGINWNFAPVVDVNTNPLNPIIGNRSFGSNVNKVTEKGLIYSKGLQENGILASIKHFPGHGDTNTDSHLDLPIIKHDLNRLNQIELKPFKTLANEHIGGIMVGHIYVPALEKKENTPASLSYNIVTNILKKTYHYQGLIITDALNMNAVSKKFPAGELDLKAFEAGNDILLFSQNVSKGKELIKKAIENRKISEERLKESVIKILKTKYLLGLNHLNTISKENIDNFLKTENHEKITSKLYENAITLIKNEENILPLKQNQNYYYLPLEEASHDKFSNTLKKYINLKIISEKEIKSLPAQSTIIIGIHKDNSTPYQSYKISNLSKKMIENLSKNHHLILNIFTSPYALKDLNTEQVCSIIISYENNDSSMKASANALVGMSKISGKLPVTVNENIKEGTGITLK